MKSADFLRFRPLHRWAIFGFVLAGFAASVAGGATATAETVIGVEGAGTLTIIDSHYHVVQGFDGTALSPVITWRAI